MVQHHLACILQQSRPHAGERPALLEELRAHAKAPSCVDLVAVSGAIGTIRRAGVLRAAGAVAIAVVAVLGRLAIVRRGLERMVIGFHDVDFGTPLAADHVGVAVVSRLTASVVARVKVAADVARRHGDEVKCEVASATHMLQVDGEADLVAEELELSNALRFPLVLAIAEHAEPSIVLDGDRVPIRPPAAADEDRTGAGAVDGQLALGNGGTALCSGTCEEQRGCGEQGRPQSARHGRGWGKERRRARYGAAGCWVGRPA
mmetsp:Transcript_3735/g.10399  ORF Transcript_3735/g.10399 Transcript_3735/m.10399 type:complete len:261 (+) Transcript_3735:883-1665(+)